MHLATIRFTIRWRRAFAATAVVAAILSLPPSKATEARTWLQQADGGSEPLGPEQARGAVVWSHGRSTTQEDYLAPTPPYMAILRQGGWDTFRFNRHRDDDTLQDSTRALVRAVQELRVRGYPRVVLAGQSFGAFLSLMAAAANENVDGVLATAPAAFGSFSEYYESWRRNADAFYPMLDALSERTRVMLFFFHGDDFDPGGRGERAEALLSARQLAHLVVDQPAALTGHWGAATPEFAARFGACMLDFLGASTVDARIPCDAAALSASVAEEEAPAETHLTASTAGNAVP
jgi:pimeloyl-ACP methyl ester carboxylesterase